MTEPSDAPQEGRPTPPQTEAPAFWFAQGPLIHGRDQGGIDIGPLIGEAKTDASARSLVEHHNATARAAAGALPSVERLARALVERGPGVYAWPVNGDRDAGTPYKVNAVYEAEKIIEILRAASPEASER
jgi:hypothetical protein